MNTDNKYEKQNHLYKKYGSNQVLSIRYDFDQHERDTCLNCSGMNAVFDILYNF